MHLKFIVLFSFILLSIISCKKEQKPIAEKEVVSSSTDYQLKQSSFPFEAYVKYTGLRFRESGKTHLSYEMNLHNSFEVAVKLTEVSIRDMDNPEKSIQTYDANYFSQYFERPGKEVSESHSIEPSGFGVLYIDLSFPDSVPAPKKLFHRIKFQVKLAEDNIIDTGIEAAVFDVPEVTSKVLSPPFRNGNWMYVSTHHRDTRAIFEGEVHITQRHAIDWVAIDDDGIYVTGDRSKNESWYTYGKEVLAMADGTILGIKDSIPENIPEADEMAVRMTRENFGGNWVLLDIGDELEVFYAHLIPGSLRVKPGDKVKKGDVLGLLGNSGNSDLAHLHMHLETNAGGVVKGEWLPFHFKQYKQLDNFSEEYMDNHIWNKNKWESSGHIKPSIRYNEYPRGEGVVEFFDE